MQIIDSYQEVLETLDFIDSQEEAREVAKTVLGLITSSLSDQEAREFTTQLPDYLDYKTLRGSPQERDRILPDECLEILGNKFDLEEDQSRALLNQVVGITLREAKGEVSDVVKDLDDEWKEYFDQTAKAIIFKRRAL